MGLDDVAEDLLWELVCVEGEVLEERVELDAAFLLVSLVLLFVATLMVGVRLVVDTPELDGRTRELVSPSTLPALAEDEVEICVWNCVVRWRLDVRLMDVGSNGNGSPNGSGKSAEGNSTSGSSGRGCPNGTGYIGSMKERMGGDTMRMLSERRSLWFLFYLVGIRAIKTELSRWTRGRSDHRASKAPKPFDR